MAAVTHLRKMRLDAGLGLRAAANLVCVDPATLSRIERGHTNAPGTTLAKLFRLYGLDHIADLVDPAVTVEVPDRPRT